MSATPKLRKLFTRLRSDGVSRRTSGLSGVGPPPELRMIQVLSIFDVARIFRRDHFPAKNSDIEVLRFFPVPDCEEVRREEVFVCNRLVRWIHTVPPLSINRVRPESPAI